ncbi:DUF4115 domain-containing protein, partial [Roseomonas sp. 18066]|uniref:DUF4115 domain-containing protein n=1 Tax=Roseomonas sp. 18066 TaxID=2681412 RepID=UPI00135C51B8
APAPGQPPGAGAPATPGTPGTTIPGTAAPGAPPPAAPVPPPLASVPAAPAAPAASGVVLRAIDNSWVQIRDSRTGRVLLNRTLQPRETFEVPNQPGLVLSTGKAEALSIELDGAATQVLANQVGVRRDISLDPERLRNATPAPR